MNKTDTENKKINKTIDEFYKKGNIQQAIDTCKVAISQNENDAQLHVRLGDLYIEKHLDICQIQQYADEAINEYQKALENCVNSSEIYFKIALAFYYKRELEKATNYLKTALEYNPQYVYAYYVLSQIAILKREFTDARDYAQKAIDIKPFAASSAYYCLYRIEYFKKSNIFKQIANLSKAILTLPFDEHAKKVFVQHCHYLRFFPSMLKIALKQFFKGTNQEIVDMYREIIDKAPGFIELYIALGKTYQDLQQYEDAICEYKMAIWLDNLNMRAYYNLCRVYEELKDYENAVKMCEKLIELQPNIAEFHCRLAQYLYFMGDVDRAIEHYQSAVTLNPNSQWTSVVSQTLGFIFQENTKNLDAAIAAYQTANNLNPNDIDIYLSLGTVFFEKGAYDNALAVYKKALEKTPYNARLHCNLGYLYWGKGNIEEAMKEYEKAIQYDNTYDIAYNNLGVIYLDDLGKVKEAIKLFETAKKHNPNYALAYYNLARSIAITGDKIEAAKLYQIALDINKYTQELDPIEVQEKIQELFD